MSSVSNINPEFMMLLKDKKYYEPIELKSKNKEGINIFKLYDYPNLQKILNLCIPDNEEENINSKNIYNNLYTLDCCYNYTVDVIKTNLNNNNSEVIFNIGRYYCEYLFADDINLIILCKNFEYMILFKINLHIIVFITYGKYL